MKKLSRLKEIELIKNCHDGCVEDRESCQTAEIIYKRYHKLVYYIITEVHYKKHIQINHWDIEDIKMRVFEKVFEKDCQYLKKYKIDGGLNLANWIKLITIRTTLNELKKMKPVMEPLDDGKIKQYDSKQVHSNNYSIEQLEKIKKNMDQLSTNYKLIIQLSFFDELSIEKIAVIMNTSKKSISERKSRALSKLMNLTKG